MSAFYWVWEYSFLCLVGDMDIYHKLKISRLEAENKALRRKLNEVITIVNKKCCSTNEGEGEIVMIEAEPWPDLGPL